MPYSKDFCSIAFFKSNIASSWASLFFANWRSISARFFSNSYNSSTAISFDLFLAAKTSRNLTCCFSNNKKHNDINSMCPFSQTGDTLIYTFIICLLISFPIFNNENTSRRIKKSVSDRCRFLNPYQHSSECYL